MTGNEKNMIMNFILSKNTIKDIHMIEIVKKQI